MSGFLRLGCILALMVSVSVEAAERGSVVVIPVREEISPAQFFFLRRALKDAEQKHAAAVVLDMNTYGGRLDSASDMVEAISKVSVPTYTFINNNAGSAGALISLSTKKIYMTPVSAIGAAAPVTSTGQDIPATMSDKLMSYWSAYYRSVAERNGYNPDIAEAFMNKEKEVKIGDDVIHAKGSVLSFSPKEAVKVVGGKPVLASGIVDSIQDLLTKEKLPLEVVTIQPTGFEVLAFWVTRFSILILGLGIVCAYLEVKMHGTLIPGICAGICFLIFFAGHYIAGLAGWEVFVIFTLGVLLLVSELFVHPGTVLPGLLGALLMLGALLWAMVDRYPDEPWLPTPGMLVAPVMNLCAAILMSLLVIYVLAKYLPTTSLYGHMVLNSANPQGPSFSGAGIDSPLRVKVGETGVAKSFLRPSGKAEFGGSIFDVVTEGAFVEPNSSVKVLAVEGMRIVVEAC